MADVTGKTDSDSGDPNGAQLERLHASLVDIDGAGVLIVGPPGAGKSDLALQLIDHGATLVADDHVIVERGSENQLLGRAPDTISGLLEVRGHGIIKLPFLAKTALRLVVSLQSRETIERMPEAAPFPLAGLELPQLVLDARDASAPARVRVVLASLET